MEKAKDNQFISLKRFEFMQEYNNYNKYTRLTCNAGTADVIVYDATIMSCFNYDGMRIVRV